MDISYQFLFRKFFCCFFFFQIKILDFHILSFYCIPYKIQKECIYFLISDCALRKGTEVISNYTCCHPNDKII